jgi:RimK family alpha-L-glutamate ligase
VKTCTERSERIGILASQTGWHVQGLQRALEARGVTVAVYSSTRFLAHVSGRPRVSVRGEPLDDCAALLVRGIPTAALEQIIFRVDVLHRLENLGVRVINSAAAIEKSVDKYYTSSLLEDAGIPTPRTIVTERFEEAVAAFDELGGDVIVKPLFGSEGVGMVRVSDRDLAHRVFRTLELGRYVYYLQEYIPHQEWDIRAFVLGGRLLAAMTRRAPNGSWKTNVAQGAQSESLRLDPALEALSLRTAQLVGADYAGVDIVCDQHGRPYVLEVNGIPGWRGLQRTVEFDVADAIAEYVLGVVG